MTDQNVGHGWVTPRPDGMVARCMGPPACPACVEEQRAKDAAAKPALAAAVEFAYTTAVHVWGGTAEGVDPAALVGRRMPTTAWDRTTIMAHIVAARAHPERGFVLLLGANEPWEKPDDVVSFEDAKTRPGRFGSAVHYERAEW